VAVPRPGKRERGKERRRKGEEDEVGELSHTKQGKNDAVDGERKEGKKGGKKGGKGGEREDGLSPT